MRSKYWLIIAALLLATPTVAFAQAEASIQEPVLVLRNRDIVGMVDAGLDARRIIGMILTSNCNFDIFPPVLQDLRRRGVPESVLEQMTLAPNGPPRPQYEYRRPRPSIIRVTVPSGTPVEVEAAYPMSSSEVDKGSPMTFLVAHPVYVNGVLTIARGALAQGRVLKAKPGQSWGRPGSLSWGMEDVVGVDGTRIPIEFMDHAKGGNRVGAVAAGAVVTGAIVFPYTAPAALIWGFKKGEDAVLQGGLAVRTLVGTNVEISGLPRREHRLIFHDPDILKMSRALSMFPMQSDRGSFRPSASFLPGSFSPSGTFLPGSSFP